jgi:hypothetical protein
VSRATERFAREAALEVERLTDERRRWREGSSELARLAELDRLTGAHVEAHIAKSDRIDADEEALRRKYFPKSARLMVSDWDGSVITVSPTGRLRTVYVPAPKPTCGDEHRDWEHQALPWVCSLEPGHDGSHVALTSDREGGDPIEVWRWPARLAPRDRIRIAAPGDAMVGMLGVVESVSEWPFGRQHADIRTDDGSRATWPADELERIDAPHVVDCLCSPCEDARWKSPAVPA